MSNVKPESLANLQPGNRKGIRNRITKEFTLKLTEYLMDDLPNFLQELEVLAPRDRVVAKLKLMDMMIPKKHEMEVEAIETPKWEIRRATVALKEDAEAAAAEVTEEATVVEETPHSDPNQLTLDLVTPAADESQEEPETEATEVAEDKPSDQPPVHPMGLTIRRASQAN